MAASIAVPPPCVYFDCHYAGFDEKKYGGSGISYFKVYFKKNSGLWIGDQGGWTTDF
ncbi:hypothetical protein [Bacillus sp. J33]|uniref:hypothetical protein n=1 Tax=Bacillus sp. J33 TaxID=935836 RepID=UPI0012F97B89|nr:hypothetical protein [Bacillus sp. J33]